MIPEAAVEAARRELAKGGYQMRPDELPYADAARRALVAAVPHMLAEAQAAAWEAGCREGLSTNPGWDEQALSYNPYTNKTPE